eukprot:TRINITY_DN44116_c0_g1_i1.p1 TRINITY_DN44116_c0_g1~~TRINITY_DN44116_c0_g1_i1.p1  ORF type:complete len:336 (-),score=47.47 TRINITY_DN44116_c0_g1_i1:199-1206(-)
MGVGNGGREGSRIAWRHKTGSVGALLDHSSPTLLRNHAKDNVRALRELGRQNRSRRAAEEEAAGKRAFKLKQFENVPSRFQSTPPATPSQRRGACARSASVPGSPVNGSGIASPAFGSRVARGLTPPPLASRQSRRHSSGSVGSPHGPCAPSTPEKLARSQKEDAFEDTDDLAGNTLDFRELERAARDLQKPKVPWGVRSGVTGGGGGVNDSRTPFDDAASTRGDFADWATARAPPAAAWSSRGGGYGGSAGGGGSSEEPPVVPPGYRLLPETERLETLAGLRQKLAELDDRYGRLPLRIETEGQRRQQRQLRDKLAETQDAVNLFSRPSVLVEV